MMGQLPASYNHQPPTSHSVPAGAVGPNPPGLGLGHTGPRTHSPRGDVHVVVGVPRDGLRAARRAPALPIYGSIGSWTRDAATPRHGMRAASRRSPPCRRNAAQEREGLPRGPDPGGGACLGLWAFRIRPVRRGVAWRRGVATWPWPRRERNPARRHPAGTLCRSAGREKGKSRACTVPAPGRRQDGRGDGGIVSGKGPGAAQRGAARAGQ